MEFIIKQYRCSILQSFSKHTFSTFPPLGILTKISILNGKHHFIHHQGPEI